MCSRGNEFHLLSIIEEFLPCGSQVNKPYSWINTRLFWLVLCQALCLRTVACWDPQMQVCSKWWKLVCAFVSYPLPTWMCGPDDPAGETLALSHFGVSVNIILGSTEKQSNRLLCPMEHSAEKNLIFGFCVFFLVSCVISHTLLLKVLSDPSSSRKPLSGLPNMIPPICSPQDCTLPGVLLGLYFYLLCLSVQAVRFEDIAGNWCPDSLDNGN